MKPSASPRAGPAPRHQEICHKLQIGSNISLDGSSSQQIPKQMADRVCFHFSSLRDVSFEIEPAALGWKLYANGEQIKAKRNKLSVTCPDGTVAEIAVQPKFDMSASFMYGTETLTPLPGVPVPLLIVAALPMGLVAVGGAIGGGLGGLAFVGNIAIARSKLPLVVRLIAMIAAGSGAVGLWYMIVSALQG